MTEKTSDTSRPEHYGVDPESVVAVYLEGKLKPHLEERYYPEGYFHPACADTARSWFLNVTTDHPAIKARELNWNDPYHCEVCEESIT